jgi:hypothetical protein
MKTIPDEVMEHRPRAVALVTFAASFVGALPAALMLLV